MASNGALSPNSKRMSNGNAAAAAAGTSQRHHSEQTFDATSQNDETGTTATTTSECSPIDGIGADNNPATGTTDEGQSTVSARHQNRTGHNHNRSTTIRHSSAYVRNYRLSRYRNALKGALPFRLNTMSDSVELPLDSVGSITSWTFAWVRRYRVVSRKKRWRWPFQRTRSDEAVEITPQASSAAAAHASSSSLPSPQPNNNNTSNAAEPPSATTTGPPSSPSQPPLVPLLPAADRCEVNAKRLLGLYKYEEQSRGRIGASMTRVAWQFCRTRVLIAIGLHTLAHLASVLMLGVFLHLAMRSIDDSWHADAPAQFLTGTVRLHRNTANNVRTLLLLSGVVVALMVQNFLRSAAHSIGLRTAIRLRTACIAAVCSRSLKATARNPIAAHQIATLAADECRQLADMVVIGPYLVAHLLGLMFCAVAAGICLGWPGIWVAFGIVGILPIGGLCALLSAIFYRRAVSFLGKKLSILDEYYAAYDPDAFIGVHDSYTKRFAGAVAAQYANLCRAELFRPGGRTVYLFTLAVVLGGAYLLWCDLQFPTELLAMASVTFVYVLLVPRLVAEWLDAMLAFENGRGVLGKVKHALTLAAPELPKMRPTRDLKVSMTDAVFQWTSVATVDTGVGRDAGVAAAAPAAAATSSSFELRIDSLAIPRQMLVGITGGKGAGKTALVHALLGHLHLRTGEFYQRDKGALYPEIPYRLDEASIRENIVFHDDWNAERYAEALRLVGLHFNAGFDERTAAVQVEDLLQLQRIGMARALYTDRDFVVLEEPLSAVDLETDLEAVFVACLERMREQGKTVVLVTQNDTLLKHCQRIYLLQNGISSGHIDYDDVARLPAYRECVDMYADRKRAARQSVHLSNLANAGGALNISTENLVALEAQKPVARAPTLTNCQCLMLVGLCLLDALYLAIIPIFVFFQLQFFNVVYDDMGTLRRAEKPAPTPWAVLDIVVFVPVILGSGWVTRTWLNHISRKRNAQQQRDLFAKLLRTSLAEQRDTHIGQLQHAMIDCNLEPEHGCAKIVYGLTVLLLCLLLCFFNRSVMFVLILVPMVDAVCRLRRYGGTVRRYAMLESESRLKLLHLLANQLRGRVVIQSFDAVQRIRSSLYRTIEENSAAEFVLRGAIAYNQHQFVFWHAITLAISLALLNAYPYLKPSEFGFEVYFYLLATAQMFELLGVQFQQNVRVQQLHGAHWLLHANSLNSPDISTLKYDT